eukprot:m.171219 g.171219  ORF g.171219 m.171219 type:complete len:635 (-) comp15348_c1_seq5:2102-4006(-)
MKYILVCGGVISGIGKGVISSSIGTLLKSQGLKVTSIKVDPYLNMDAGTFSPYEHGEVYVLDDGGEVDLDLGNYERFLDCTLHRDNNITTGKIYQEVISNERKGDYLGKTVQVVPHITDAIQDWVERVAARPVDGTEEAPDVCVIELGGTIGDIESMPFVEAFRQFQFRVGKENMVFVHVSLVPQTNDGEQKTKPTQHSIRELRGLGISPDLIVCRGLTPLEESVKNKVSMFCHVPPKQVLSVHDCSSIYRVPLLLEKQDITDILVEKLKLNMGFRERLDNGLPVKLVKWKEMADRFEAPTKSVKIALVGKYTKMSDAYASVSKALRHSCLLAGYKLDLMYIEASDLEEDKTKTENPERYHDAWGKMCQAQGILVPGGFGQRGIEGKLLAAKWARERKIPYLGVCLGLQIAAIEFARNVLGMTNANSTEVNPDTPHPVVIDMPEISTTQMGGTQRLGKRRTVFHGDSVAKKLYFDAPYVEERHRHRYEVNPKLISQFEEKGMKFVGRDVEGNRMEILELEGHPYFVATQFHPEFLSRPMRPSPVFLGLILAARGKLANWLSHRPTLEVGSDKPVWMIPATSNFEDGRESPMSNGDEKSEEKDDQVVSKKLTKQVKALHFEATPIKSAGSRQKAL